MLYALHQFQLSLPYSPALMPCHSRPLTPCASAQNTPDGAAAKWLASLVAPAHSQGGIMMPGCVGLWQEQHGACVWIILGPTAVLSGESTPNPQRGLPRRPLRTPPCMPFYLFHLVNPHSLQLRRLAIVPRRQDLPGPSAGQQGQINKARGGKLTVCTLTVCTTLVVVFCPSKICYFKPDR